MSIIQGGNGIPYLARQVYLYICEGGDFSNFEVDLKDIPEYPLKFAVEKVPLELYLLRFVCTAI